MERYYYIMDVLEPANINLTLGTEYHTKSYYFVQSRQSSLLLISLRVIEDPESAPVFSQGWLLT